MRTVSAMRCRNRLWRKGACDQLAEEGRRLNEMRSHARHTRTYCAGGVAGGVMHSVRYCVDDVVSINSDPSVAHKVAS